MFDFHEKRKIKSFLYSKMVIGGLFMVAIVMSVTVYDRYVVAEEMKAKLQTRRSELEELHVRAQALESKVKYLEDERGIEEELRNRFDVAREGEQVVILIDPKRIENGEASSTSSSSDSDEKSIGKSFWSVFKIWDSN